MAMCMFVFNRCKQIDKRLYTAKVLVVSKQRGRLHLRHFLLSEGLGSCLTTARTASGKRFAGKSARETVYLNDGKKVTNRVNFGWM